MPKITHIKTGQTFDCTDDTILRAALRAGFGFPYECNVGSCGNCRFELVSGEVKHLRVDAPAYTERDKQRKRFLGCQAQPLGDCAITVTLRDQYRSAHLPQRTKARLITAQDITHDIREFHFALEKPAMYRPGQYALLSLPNVDGARAYSMSDTPGDGSEWSFQIRRTPNGAATGFLFDRVAIGDVIGIDGPYGMAYLREDADRDILCLAGGSGLSPMMSITRAVARAPELADRNLHFLFGGRTTRDIAGESMLRELPGYGEHIKYYAAISMPENGSPASAWTGHVGHVPDVARNLFGDQLPAMEIYFAGPPAMANAVIALAVEFKVPQAQLHFDQYF